MAMCLHYVMKGSKGKAKFPTLCRCLLDPVGMSIDSTPTNNKGNIKMRIQSMYSKGIIHQHGGPVESLIYGRSQHGWCPREEVCPHPESVQGPLSVGVWGHKALCSSYVMKGSKGIGQVPDTLPHASTDGRKCPVPVSIYTFDMIGNHDRIKRYSVNYSLSGTSRDSQKSGKHPSTA
jgi:hypothetical protein